MKPRPTLRDLRIEGMAGSLREASRFPSGTPRLSPDLARTIAGRLYQYLVSEGVIRR